MHHRRKTFFVLAVMVSACAVSSCSASITPFGGSSLRLPTSSCSVSKGTPPVPLDISRAAGGTTPFVPVCVDGQGPFLFVLDTGAAASLVGTQLAGAAHLPSTSPSTSPLDVGCTAATQEVLIKRWSVGGVALSGQAVFTASIPGFGLSGEPAGILGGDVLSRFGAIRVDYRARKLTVLAPESSPSLHATILSATRPLQPPPPLLVPTTPQSAALLTVLKTGSTALATTATVFGHGSSSPFVVDTGSPSSTVAPSLARRFRLSSAGHTIAAPNVGCRGTAKTVDSGAWSIGTVPMSNRTLVSVALEGASHNGTTGTIGSDVLSDYGSFVLDYRTAILWLGAG